MSRIASAFRPGSKALIAYLTVGYPRLEMTLAAVPLLERAGCDLVELGIPFSDPLADGATIQRASEGALKGGITPEHCLEVVKQLRPRVSLPLVFMSYYNPILASGLDSFCQQAATAGLDGLIIPDLPPEEGLELGEATARHGLDLIYLLAPTSTEERVAMVVTRSRGFIYLVSLTGVTGPRDELSPELEGFVARVRASTNKPLCVGFGVASAEQAARIARVADGVIVGSRLIQLLEEDRLLEKLGSFIRSLREALDRASLGESS